MVVPALLFVIVIGAKITEGYAQNDVGKCCSDCECKGYSLAGGTWTQESCCKSGNPCWCDQNNRCQPSCSSSSQQAQLGRCYSTKDCQQYSRAGGFWTKNDCCSSRGRCWCDQTGKCQSSCSTSNSPSTATLGKCYSTRDCQAYSAFSGKWSQTDCCSSSGGLCWCDQYGRCQLSCSKSVSADQQISVDHLGKCYSDRDCQQYSAAGGKWTKEDCCSSGSPCWCDPNRRCQPSCSNDSTNEESPLGKCYSTRDCQQYSVAGGSWTKKDCCRSSGRCWCDKYGHCQPTCSSSTPRPNARLGKCYSTRDCKTSYSRAGGSWTKEDCCSINGGRCWCDLNHVCQPSCSTSVSVSEQVTMHAPKKEETPSSARVGTHAITKPTRSLTKNDAEIQTTTFVVSTGSKQSHTASGSLMYLWLLVVLAVCPCLCCIWMCCRYKERLPSNLNLTYIKVDAGPNTSSPI